MRLFGEHSTSTGLTEKMAEATVCDRPHHNGRLSLHIDYNDQEAQRYVLGWEWRCNNQNIEGE